MKVTEKSKSFMIVVFSLRDMHVTPSASFNIYSICRKDGKIKYKNSKIFWWKIIEP